MCLYISHIHTHVKLKILKHSIVYESWVAVEDTNTALYFIIIIVVFVFVPTIFCFVVARDTENI